MGMLDLDHLSRQTLGDCALKRKLLELFVVQSDTLVAGLRSARDPREAAHTINGSARAIGAFELAAIATRVETADVLADSDIDELTSACDRTLAFIRDYLGS